MQNIWYAVLVLGTMGLVFGLVLAVASRIFAVKTDERLEPMLQALPGANCGGCGYSGCGAYAQAVLDGKAKIGLCVAGGDAVAGEMAKLMGVAPVKTQRRVAMVKCRGTDVRQKAVYDGIADCLAASKVAGHGPLVCEYGCLGFGTCVSACKFDALHIVDGRARVDAEKCTGCLACAKLCPRGIIVPVPYDADIVVACSSKAAGSVTVRGCSVGCIGCSRCEQVCPNGAIHVTEHLASIDYEKCVSCGLCAEVCPRNLISDSNLRRDMDMAQPRQR